MTDGAMVPAAPSWQVVGQAPATEISPTGDVEQGMRVTYRTAAGVTAYVFVPLAQYNTTTVRAMITAAASTNDQVSSLTSDTP